MTQTAKALTIVAAFAATLASCNPEPPPPNPFEGWRQVGNLRPQGSKFDCAVAGDYLFAASSEGGLEVYDVSDKAKPDLVAWRDTNYAVDLDLVGTTLYLADAHAGLYIFDVSSPVNPVQLALYAGYIQGVQVAGTKAYLATYTGLTILDVANPAAPAFVSSLSCAGSTMQAVHLAGNYAYLAAYDGGLHVINISDEAHPALVKTIATTNNCQGVEVSGNYLFASAREAGVRVIDISDPPNAGIVATFDTDYYAVESRAVGNRLYISDTMDGCIVADITTPTAMAKLGSIAPAQGSTFGVAIAGTTAYLADSYAGLYVYDIADLASPVALSRTDVCASAQSIAMAGDYIFASDAIGNYRIDAADWRNPSIVQEHAAPANMKLAGKGNLLAAAGWSFFIYDYSVPTAPAEVKSIALGAYCQKLRIEGNYAYLALGAAGLRIIDMTDPAAAATVATVDTPGSAVDVAVAGSYAYVADDAGGVAVVSVANPAAAALVASLGTPGAVAALAVSGDTLYAAGPSLPLTVVDVSNPGAPKALANYPDHTLSLAIAVRDGALFMGSDTSLKVFDLADPRAPALRKRVDLDFWPYDIMPFADHCMIGMNYPGVVSVGAP